MSVETSQWTELTQIQTSFFAGHIESAKQIAFSPASQEAGIVALNASRYSFLTDPHQPLSAIAWPDPYEQNTACIVMGDTRRNGNQSSFVRITETDDSYAVEGVALRLNYGRGANLYGRQLLLRHGVEDDLDIPHVGAGFLMAAIEKAAAFAKTDSPLKTGKPEIIGVEGNTTARLFRSLNSLGSNLVVAGTTAEKGVFTDQTYDLAQTLLKVAVTSIAQNPTTENSIILCAPNTRPFGAIFESEHDGITVIRRTDAYPDTIAVASIGRPRVGDSTIFVEEYSVQARGVSLEMMTIPAEAYNPKAILGALTLIGANPKEADASIESSLDDRIKAIFRQRIARILTERIGLTS